MEEMRPAIYAGFFGALFTALFAVLAYLITRYLNRRHIKVRLHWQAIVWIGYNTPEGRPDAKRTPDSYLMIYCSITTKSPTLIIGRKIAMFSRKKRSVKWQKAEILNDVSLFTEIMMTIPELRAKAIPDPQGHNLISKPIDINKEKALTGYIISRGQSVDFLRDQNHQLRGYLKLVLDTPFGKKYEHIVKLEGVPSLYNLDYSPLP